jgi:hypothetical protein
VLSRDTPSHTPLGGMMDIIPRLEQRDVRSGLGGSVPICSGVCTAVRQRVKSPVRKPATSCLAPLQRLGVRVPPPCER